MLVMMTERMMMTTAATTTTMMVVMIMMMIRIRFGSSSASKVALRPDEGYRWNRHQPTCAEAFEHGSSTAK